APWTRGESWQVSRKLTRRVARAPGQLALTPGRDPRIPRPPMNRHIRLCVWALMALAPAWALLRAQDRPAPRTSGRGLILQNHRTLEGEIERAGDLFVIRRGDSELTVSVREALCLCADWDEAYGLMCKQANLRDPDERVRLANWCQMNGLTDRALAEVNEALR